MRIECLAARPGAVPLVAAWQHEAFGYLNPVTSHRYQANPFSA